MTEQDRNFLREYHFFTAHHGVTVARLIVARMRSIRQELKSHSTQTENIALGDELGHLLAHLHVLNYMQAEATCAILYGLVNRHKAIAPSVLGFDPKGNADFLAQLVNGDLTLSDFGINVPDDLSVSPHGQQAHTCLQARLRDLSAVLGNTDVRRAYNKLKHCGIVVRQAELLSSEDTVEGLEADSVYIPTTDSTSIKYAPHQLTLVADENGVPPEEKYLSDIAFFGRLVAEFAKLCGSAEEEPKNGEQ